jgi:catechol 2,3-dioxygenase-like lactoylglutathione lyase family enzyme
VIAPAVVAIEIADEPDAWRAAGFAVDGDRTQVGGITFRLVGRSTAKRIASWTWHGLTGDGPLDGLVTHAGEPANAAPGGHPNGATVLDHVVVVTPRLDRSIAAFEARGLEVRRVRHTDQYGPAFRQVFFRGGETIIEVIGPDEPPADDDRAAHFYGLAFTVADLDAAAEVLGDGLGRIKHAVQPGRRIATLRDEQYDISVPIALMSA